MPPEIDAMNQTATDRARNSRFILVVRWVGVLPAALLASGLAQFAYVMGASLFAPEPGEFNYGIDRLLILVGGNILFGYGFVFAAVYVAPSRKLAVARASAAVFTFLSCLLVVPSIRAFGWTSVLEIAITIAAAWYAVYFPPRGKGV